MGVSIGTGLEGRLPGGICNICGGYPALPPVCHNPSEILWHFTGSKEASFGKTHPHQGHLSSGQETRGLLSSFCLTPVLPSIHYVRVVIWSGMNTNCLWIQHEYNSEYNTFLYKRKKSNRNHAYLPNASVNRFNYTTYTLCLVSGPHKAFFFSFWLGWMRMTDNHSAMQYIGRCQKAFVASLHVLLAQPREKNGRAISAEDKVEASGDEQTETSEKANQKVQKLMPAQNMKPVET